MVVADYLVADFRKRLVAASHVVADMAYEPWVRQAGQRERLKGKDEGIRLALSYLDEMLRESRKP